jgi:phospholipid-binding lipoprotein MlaA
MQGDGTAAGTIIKRFAANTFWGFFGIFDTASQMEIPNIKRDFGETLAVWGIENSGPYLVLPLIGPSNVRDTVGLGVDAVLTPIDWALYHEKGLVYTRQSLDAFRTRDNANDLMESLRKSSTDFYATLRSMAQQNRKKEINTLLGKTNQETTLSYDFEFPEEDYENEE